MELTVHKKETIQLAVGHMITIMRATQEKEQYMSREQMSNMKVSLPRNCSTTRNAQIQIHSLQKFVEEALVSVVLSPELNAHRSTKKFQH